jgi:hypothetical protein
LLDPILKAADRLVVALLHFGEDGLEIGSGIGARFAGSKHCSGGSAQEGATIHILIHG